MKTLDQLTQDMEAKGVRPSIQRLKVLEYLHRHPCHPTAEEVFEALLPEIPTLSRTTVYNTLHAFTKSGLVNCLNVDGVETRYDAMLEDHGHFRCNQCGKVTNFSADVDSITTRELENYKIEHKNIIFTGICPECSLKIKP